MLFLRFLSGGLLTLFCATTLLNVAEGSCGVHSNNVGSAVSLSQAVELLNSAKVDLVEVVGQDALVARVASLMPHIRKFETLSRSKDYEDIADYAAYKHALALTFEEFGLTRAEATRVVNRLVEDRSLMDKLKIWLFEIETILVKEDVPSYVAGSVAAFAALWVTTPISFSSILSVSGIIGPWGLTPGLDAVEIAIVFYAVLFGAKGFKFVRPAFDYLSQHKHAVPALETRSLDDKFETLRPQITLKYIKLFENVYRQSKKISLQILCSIALLYSGGKDIDAVFERALVANSQVVAGSQKSNK